MTELLEPTLAGLMSCHLFRGLARDEVEALLGHSRLLVCEAGHTVFARNDACDDLYVVVSGVVELRAGMGTQPARLSTEFVRASEVFGEVEAVGSRPETGLSDGRCHEAVVGETAVLIGIEGQLFRQWLAARPEVLQRLSTTLCRRYRRVVALLGDVSFKPVEIRLARQVLDLADIFGLRDGPTIRLRRKMTHQQLADALGVTRRSVLNVLHLWEEGSIVHHDRNGYLSILDRPRLLAISEIEPGEGWQSDAGHWLEPIDAALAAGYNTRARDLAMEAVQRFPNNVQIKHRAVLAAARAGAVAEALALYRDLGLTGDIPDEDIAALEPRLIKDLFLAEKDPERRNALALESAAKYERVFVRTGGHYPAVNAATMYHLGGRPDRAAELASSVLAAFACGAEGYYALASCAEAALLLGQVDEARRFLWRAAKAWDANFGTIATTRRQLQLILRDAAEGDTVLSALPQAAVAHFTGPRVAPGGPADIAAKIGRTVAMAEIGVAYGSLAAGLDILFAEAMLRKGVELHVVLPCRSALFRKRYVAPAGGDWVTRYDRCIELASRLHILAPWSEPDRDFGLLAATRFALGLTLRRGREMQADCFQLTAGDDGTDSEALSQAAFEVRLSGIKESLDVGGGLWPIPPAMDPQPDVSVRLCPMVFIEIISGPGKASLDDLMERLGVRDQSTRNGANSLCIEADDIAAASRLAITALRSAAPGSQLRVVCDIAAIEAVSGAGGADPYAVWNAPQVLSPPGAAYASEVFVAEATLMMASDVIVEYAGRFPTREKQPPLPLYRIQKVLSDGGA